MWALRVCVELPAIISTYSPPPVEFHGGAIFSRHVYLWLKYLYSNLCYLFVTFSKLSFESRFISNYVHVSACICTHEYRCLQRPEEGSRVPGTGVPSGCGH